MNWRRLGQPISRGTARCVMQYMLLRKPQEKIVPIQSFYFRLNEMNIVEFDIFISIMSFHGIINEDMFGHHWITMRFF